MAGQRKGEKRCDALKCPAVARWRVFLHIPAVEPPDPEAIEFDPGPELRDVVVPLPIYVCDRHKLSKDQAERLVTEKLHTRLIEQVRRATGRALTLRARRAWVAHELFASA